MNRFIRTLPILFLNGCQQQAAIPERNESRTEAAANPNAAINAAAEPFEALTEQAATADWPKIDQLAADAKAAADSVRTRLGSASGSRLDTHLTALATARKAQDRLGTALAAVEGYRTLIEAQDPATARPPIPVSLLDYSGFRYDALAHSQAVDWQEMAKSAAFARAQWAALKPTIKSAATVGVVDSALEAMDEAVKRKDITFAQKAAATELALVDLLEEQVAAQ